MPNLNEEQTLIKFFKFFDLENTGICTLREWIKTIEKIGVIFPKVHDNQQIFLNYDLDNTGIINYKEFAAKFCSNNKITKMNNKFNSINSAYTQHNDSLEKFHMLIKNFYGRLLLTMLKYIKVSFH